MVFTIYGRGGHVDHVTLDHVTKTILNKLSFLKALKAEHEIWL